MNNSQSEKSQTKIGIVSYGLYTPADFETAEQIARQSGISPSEVNQLGIIRKCRPADEDQPVVMANKAAKQAFQSTHVVHPRDVDVLIWTGEEYKDYICQTASIRLQEELGCTNAWAFDLVGQGVTTILGLRVARDLMHGDASIKTVLLAGGTRNIDLVDYRNPDTHFLLAMSASGSAVLLQRGHSENQLLELSFHVDPDMADEVYVPIGGTQIPFHAKNIDSPQRFYNVQHPQIVSDYLKNRWAQTLCDTIQSISTDAAFDYLALRNLAPVDRALILNQMNLTSDQSQPLDNWGHHGMNDVILSLDLGIRQGLVRNGSMVAMATAGIGFTYAAALIKWGS
jgi:3-oxoacyl-[acyl-carrier-protein] synthase-3